MSHIFAGAALLRAQKRIIVRRACGPASTYARACDRISGSKCCAAGGASAKRCDGQIVDMSNGPAPSLSRGLVTAIAGLFITCV